MKTQVLLMALPWQTGALRFPVGLPSGRTPWNWALAAAASSLSWPVAENVRSNSVLRRLEGLPKRQKHRRKQFLGLPCSNPTSKGWPVMDIAANFTTHGIDTTTVLN